jgi:hypothetical protein
MPQWSPSGDWILYPAAAGLDLISPDGKLKRTLTKRPFLACSFSKDGSHVYGVFQHGRGTRVAALFGQREDRRGETSHTRRFSARDGLAGRLQHSSGWQARSHFHCQVPITDLDVGGFEQPPKNWFARLLRR